MQTARPRFAPRRGHVIVHGLLLAFTAGCASHSPPLATPAHGVIGVEARHRDREFWIRRDRNAAETVLDAAAIAAQNSKLQQSNPSVTDLERLPPTLTAVQVRAWVGKLGTRPARRLFDEHGNEISAATLDALVNDLQLDEVPGVQRTRYGMVVRRADLRTFPTRRRVFDSRDGTDIDRFQESALFPGTPLAIVHASKDGEWLFVVSPSYSAESPSPGRRRHYCPASRGVGQSAGGRSDLPARPRHDAGGP